jgi:xanthine dehydrogenase YagS FAD-binding subunit
VNPFRYAQARDLASAMTTVRADPRARYVAGGTNVIDLMKEYVERPSVLVDINALPMAAIEPHADGVRIGALARMSDVADHPAIARGFPVVAQALLASASPQLRNMASIGGNVMQRTRCAYFRDVAQPCNKRAPGTGCSAIGGDNRRHAVIGGSDHCICTHASDLAVALLAVDAVVHVRGAAGDRTVPFEHFYLLPGSTPQRETVLQHGELVTAVDVRASDHAAHSSYLKVRDRASYEFALVSVAAALDVHAGRVRAARVALGGVAPVPWRAHDAERVLAGAPATAATFAAAAAAAARGMRGYGQNDFKVALTRRAVARALAQAGGIA